MDIDINNIINEDTFAVNAENIELPASMQAQIGGNTDNTTTENTHGESSNTDNTTTMTLEQLSGMLIMGYNAVSCAIYRRIEPTFDASLTQEECQTIEQPLKLVLKEYNVEVTPVTALCIAILGVNVVKVMQLRAYRQTLAVQDTSNTNLYDNSHE